MPFFPSTLKARITLITTALAAVLGAGIVTGSLYYAHRDLQEALQIQQDSNVKLSVDQLDAAIEDRVVLLAHLAPQLRDDLAGPLDAAARARLLGVLQRGIPLPAAFNAVFLANAQGTTVLASGVPLDIGDRPYFLEAARTLAPVISAPIQSRANGMSGVIVAVPVLSASKEFLGIAGGWLDLSTSNFLVEISHNRLGASGFYCLVSAGPQPVYVQHPDPARAHAPAHATGDTCGVADKDGPLEFLLPSRPVIARRLMSTTGWELVAVLPAPEAFAPLHHMQQRFLLLSLGALAVVAALLWLAVRRLLTPLSHLHHVVRDSAADLSAFERLPERLRADEIGDLSRAFVKLMHDVRERRHQLDRSERRLRAVTDTLPSLLAFIDTDERYVFNNLAYERLLGVPVAELRGKTVREVLGEARYARTRPYLQRALAGTAVTFEAEEHEPEYRCMEISFRPEWTLDGRGVAGVHSHAQDITQRKLETMRLSHISRTDHLTQLLNRGAFETQLQAAMTRSRETGRLMALLFLDMDRFKAVNDIHGHATGDLLLRAFARRVRRCVRESDVVARLGGDEFAVILEDIGEPANAGRVAQAILGAVGRPFDIGGVAADVDVSIGIALYRGGPQQDDELLRQADALLYRAKDAGRGRYEIGPPELAMG